MYKNIRHYSKNSHHDMILEILWHDGPTSGWFSFKFLNDDVDFTANIDNVRLTTRLALERLVEFKDDIVSYMFENFIEEKYIRIVLEHEPLPVLIT